MTPMEDTQSPPKGCPPSTSRRARPNKGVKDEGATLFQMGARVLQDKCRNAASLVCVHATFESAGEKL